MDAVAIEFIVRTGMAGIGVVAMLFLLTGKLATRRELDTANTRADKWEAVAIEALRQNQRLTTTAEVAVDALRAFPKPDQPDRGGTP